MSSLPDSVGRSPSSTRSLRSCPACSLWTHLRPSLSHHIVFSDLKNLFWARCVTNPAGLPARGRSSTICPTLAPPHLHNSHSLREILAALSTAAIEANRPRAASSIWASHKPRSTRDMYHHCVTVYDGGVSRSAALQPPAND